MKKRIIRLSGITARASIVMMLILAAVSGSSGQNLLRNGSFEQQDSAWQQSAWNYRSDIFSWCDTLGYGNSGCICITVDSSAPNDARFTQDLDGLLPNGWYTLSGWIQGDDVRADGAMGAGLCIMGTWSRTASLTGTFDWSWVSIDFQADSLGRATVGCRLGYWGSTASGTVRFDEVTVRKRNTVSSEHITLVLDEEDRAVISDTLLDRWLSHLDDVYTAYAGLTGFMPYAGSRIIIQSVNGYPGGWAVAGNPIRWYRPYIAGELERIAAHDDWSFGILHEIGHDFDDNGWNFDPEFFANFKMHYALDTLEGRVLQGGSYYVGDSGAVFYAGRYQDEKAEFEQTGDLQGYSGCLMHRFIEIRKTIGWNPFKLAFHHLYSLPDSAIPGNKADKYRLFLSTLSDFAGRDVSLLIPADDTAEFIAYLGGGTTAVPAERFPSAGAPDSPWRPGTVSVHLSEPGLVTVSLVQAGSGAAVRSETFFRRSGIHTFGVNGLARIHCRAGLYLVCVRSATGYTARKILLR